MRLNPLNRSIKAQITRMIANSGPRIGPIAFTSAVTVSCKIGTTMLCKMLRKMASRSPGRKAKYTMAVIPSVHVARRGVPKNT